MGSRKAKVNRVLDCPRIEPGTAWDWHIGCFRPRYIGFVGLRNARSQKGQVANYWTWHALIAVGAGVLFVIIEKQQRQRESAPVARVDGGQNKLAHS